MRVSLRSFCAHACPTLAVLGLSCSTSPSEPRSGEPLARSVQAAQVPPGPTATPNPPPASYDLLAGRVSRDHYLEDRLAALRDEHVAPAIGAALVTDGLTSAAAVSGVRRFATRDPALLGDAFMLKSCTKVMTGYLAARFIENQTPISRGSPAEFRWTTTILDVFPELARIIHPAYVNTTVEALMMHTSGMPYMPLTEGNDEFANITSSLTGRRYEYVKAAVLDAPEVPSPYGGGSIIVAAMLERITGQAWEELMDAWVYADVMMTNSGVGSDPYPPNLEQVTSHTRDTSSGQPVPWAPPPDYATEPHAPAGRNPHASILDFARFAAANLLPAANRPGSLGDTALAAALFQPAGSDHTRSGWGVGMTGWDNPGVPVLRHSGTDGRDRAVVYVIPSQEYAMVVMTNVDDPNASITSSATHEIAALKRHFATASAYDDVLNIGQPATATSTYGAGYEANKANDGSLLTRWAAATAETSPTLEIGLHGLTNVRQIRIAEHYQRIESFVLEVKQESTFNYHWVEVASGTTVGPNYLASFPELGALAIRLRVSASSGAVNIAEMWAL